MQTGDDTDMNGADDFDFLIGKWRVRHRRLKQRLENNHEWIEFTGTMTSQKVLGGFGNIDDNVLDVSNPAYRALACEPMTRTQSFGPFGGLMPALRPKSIHRLSVGLRMALAHFMATTHSKENRFEYDFFGKT